MKNSYLFQCSNKKLKDLLKYLYRLAIIAEVIVSTFGFVLIGLSEDYLNEVFSAICTVAVLGNAILSLLFGVYDKKTLGVPFQDVLNHSLIGSEQKFTIEVMTTSIVFALVFYIFQWYNLLFAVLIQNVCLLLFSCHDLWRFLSDNEMQKKTINEIIHNVSPSKYAVYVDNWFKQLDDALVPNNKEETQEYCDLFKLVIETAPEKEEQIRACISRHLQMYFNTACEKVGFVEAFDLLREVIVYARKDDQSATWIALKYLEQLKTKDQVDIVNCEVADLLKEIFDDSKLNEEDKMLFAYNYFCAVFDNVQMNFLTKNKQINDILNYLCDMHESTYGLIKAKIVMNIVKYKILDNEDIESRRRLFCLLIESLKKRGSFSSDKFYIATISEIYRAFFFAIYLEDGSLTESYRNDLLTLFHSTTSEKDRVSLSFMTLILERKEAVVNWLAMNAVSFGIKPKIFWDYYSPAMNWKKMIWTMEEVTFFAFCVYHLIGLNSDRHPFVSMLESNEYSDNEKVSVCQILLNFYSDDGFSVVMKQRLRLLSEFSGVVIDNSNSFWKQEHTYYQEKILELLSSINQSHFTGTTMSNESIWTEVQKQYSEDRLFVFDSSRPLFPGVRHTFAPTYERINKNFWEHVPQRVSEKIRKYLNSFVGKELPQLGISFNLQGVNTLLETLRSADFQYRNYKYVDDISLRPALRSTSEYKELSSLLETIPYDSRSKLHGYFFLKQNRIPFNFQLKYHLCSLSNKQCENCVKPYKNDEGMYEIGGYRFDYEHAVKYTRANVVIEDVTIFINVGLGTDDGFQIRFDR